MGDESSLKSSMARPVAGTARERSAARRARAAHESRFFKATYPDSPAALDMSQPGQAPEERQPVQQAVSAHRPISLGFDIWLLLDACILVVFGLLMVNSASWRFSLDYYGSSSAIFIRQLVWTAGGLGVMIFLIFFDYHRLRKFVLPLMIVTVLALFVVLFLHDLRNGAVRTITEGSIQPSELAKLALIIYLGVWLSNRGDTLRLVGVGLLPLGAILGFLGALIYLQPDLSAVLTVFALGGMLFFLAGGEIKQIVVVLIVGFVVGMLVVQSGLYATGKDRVDSFLAGLQNPLAASDHVQRSLESFVRGGWIGVGIGKGEAKLTGLPFPHTDSIFAVVGEETGVLGAAALAIMYVVLLWRGLTIARRAPDELGSLLAAGCSLWIVMEATINMAVMVGLLPFAGNALPFMSAGGSNRVVSLAAIGILLNISRLYQTNKEEKERTLSAVVDLRRRDWRRSISRPGGHKNTKG